MLTNPVLNILLNRKLDYDDRENLWCYVRQFMRKQNSRCIQSITVRILDIIHRHRFRNHVGVHTGVRRQRLASSTGLN
jgi:hypothetical protein